MSVKPILFNTEMVRAILVGMKTCTRRVVKLPKNMSGRPVGKNGDIGFMYLGGIKRPPYQQGDILYVRETWFYEHHMEDRTAGVPNLPSERYSHRFVYKADNPDYPVNIGVGESGWHPSIHMPKEAARIWLKVTGVRVERLQDITEEGAEKEGCEESVDAETKFRTSAILNFYEVWNSTIKKSDLDRYGWKANPWVWVIEFERCEKPKEV